MNNNPLYMADNDSKISFLMESILPGIDLDDIDDLVEEYPLADEEKFQEMEEKNTLDEPCSEIFESGYPRDCFLSSISEDYICGICREVARNPYNLSCPHLFCESCLTKMIKSGQKMACPVCRTSIEAEMQLQHSSYLIKIMSSFPIRCPYYEKGCPWTGTIGFQESVLINHFRTGCMWGGFETCKECGIQIRKDDAKNHKEICRETEGKCKFCDFRGSNKQIYVHEAIGEYSHQPCASTQRCIMHDCNVLIPKNKSEKHLKTECSKFLRICYGCEEQHYMPKYEFHKHMEEKKNDPIWMKKWIDETTRGIAVGDLRYLGLESTTHNFETNRVGSVICKVAEIHTSADNVSITTECIPNHLRMVNHDIYTGPAPIMMKRLSENHISKIALDCLNHHECSFGVTGRSYISQPFYRCKTCSGRSNTGVCAVCAVDCHFGHDLELSMSDGNFCDCPTGDMKLVGIKNCRAASHVKVHYQKDKSEDENSEVDIRMIIRGNLDIDLIISPVISRKIKKITAKRRRNNNP